MPGDVGRVAAGLLGSVGGVREGDTEGERVLNGGTYPEHLPQVICKEQCVWYKSVMRLSKLYLFNPVCSSLSEMH